MPSIFQQDDNGYFVEADPNSDLDYSITCWLEGLLFTDLTWEISPEVTDVPYNSQINSAPVTIDEVEYAIGKVASVWLKDLTAGQTYTVTLHATFTGNRKDDRSFRVICKSK